MLHRLILFAWVAAGTPVFVLHPPQASFDAQTQQTTTRTLRLAQVFAAGESVPRQQQAPSLRQDAFEMLGSLVSAEDLADPRAAFLRVKDVSSAAYSANADSFTVEAVNGAVPMWSHASSKAMRRKERHTDNHRVDIYHKDMLMPNASDPATVLALARMTSNSYTEPGESGWVDIPPYNLSDRFGWESDGIRGYVFADEARDMVVIALKGTSLAVPFIGGGATSPKDKLNDNMIYFNLANTIYMAVSLWYPSSKTIWLTGHSLGGALASLVGLTHDLPVFAYEAPGDFMYALRIGLIPELPPNAPPETGTRAAVAKANKKRGKAKSGATRQLPLVVVEENAPADDAIEMPSNHNASPSNPIAATDEPGGTPRVIPDYGSFLSTLEIYHIGNWKDPIYMGECTSNNRWCWLVGYALETKCHSGKKCVYQEHGSDLNINYHSIDRVINEFLKELGPVPECKVVEQCDECGAWTWKE
ncbi:putative lipase atg15 [Podochytrium sp. JEL0797]|nr:putative lipase atg15 [Podochytrium sp. JEL0797]